MQPYHFIIYLLFAMHCVWYGVSGGLLLLRHKQQHDRSRIFIGTFFLYLSFGSCSFITTAILRGDLEMFLGTIMEPYPILLSFLATMLMVAYIVEVLHPHWLTLRRSLLVLLPWIGLTLAWLIYHGLHGFHYAAITHLSDYTQVLPNIHQPDVLLRSLLLALYLLYMLVLPFIPYNWRTSNIDANRIVWLKLLVAVCIVGFVLGMGLRVSVAMIIYLVMLDLLTVSVFIIEFRQRIPVPVTHPEAANEDGQQVHLSVLAEQLKQLLEQDFWLNPDVNRDDVCRMLCTNRTYLSSAIQELGYSNLSEMINRQRAKYVHDRMLQDPSTSLSDLFFQSGFRNRSTALHSFVQLYGCKPSEFPRPSLDNISQEDEHVTL